VFGKLFQTFTMRAGKEYFRKTVRNINSFYFICTFSFICTYTKYK